MSALTPAVVEACIHYQHEAYTTAGAKLMGRNAAGESFLRGYLAHGRARQWWAQVGRSGDAEAFTRAVRAAGRTEDPIRLVQPDQSADLARAGLLYYPGPSLGDQAWRRRLVGDSAWSLCGLTHTLCSEGAMDAVTGLLTAPVQPWDALVCTSSAGRSAVMSLLDAQAQFLAARLGSTRVVLPQLPVIPLGVHAQDFAFSAGQRAAARLALSADEATHVVLFVGRLSFHAKAHPWPMYQALQAAAADLPAGQRVLLLECGQFPNDYIREAFQEAADLAAPRVQRAVVDGRDLEKVRAAWAAADVFCSLSDNLQETFGLTPVEAMAAGLPVVVSDWDGYKETVRHGEDGFRIPTLMPAAGLATDLAARHALGSDTYDRYIGQTAHLVAVDAAEAARAFSALFRQPALRQRMGEAGRQRARQVFDWSVLIPRYEALWAELQERRRAAAADGPSAPDKARAWPARMDPFTAFAGYATSTLGPGTHLALAVGGLEQALALAEQGRRLKSMSFAARVQPSQDETRELLQGLLAGPALAEVLVQGFAPARRLHLLRTLAWLAKIGVVTWVREGTP